MNKDVITFNIRDINIPGVQQLTQNMLLRDEAEYLTAEDGLDRGPGLSGLQHSHIALEEVDQMCVKPVLEHSLDQVRVRAEGE